MHDMVVGVLVTVVAAIILAVGTAIIVRPLRRWFRWLNRHVEEDKREKLTESIRSAVEPRFAAIEQQLTPNGGASLADKLDRVEIKLEAGLKAADANSEALAACTESLAALNTSYVKHIAADLEFQRVSTSTMDRIVANLVDGPQKQFDALTAQIGEPK
jgi:uncharacterized membrane protein YhiD involved in acid resistance